MKELSDSYSAQAMARPFLVHRKSVWLCLLLLCVLVGTGCDSNERSENEPRALAGVWRGTITHVNPNLNGTLTLTMTQAGDALGGTANWRFSSHGISGVVIGTAVEQGSIIYTLDFGGDEMYLHEVTLRGDALTGTWVSARSNSIKGTVSLQRQ